MKQIDRTNINTISADNIYVIYNTHGYGIYKVCGVMANHSMSIDDCLALCGIDMDAEAEKLGWDGWNYDDLDLVLGSDLIEMIGTDEED